MPRKGENIYKRKDGRWEGRYIKSRTPAGKANYGYVYAKTYREVKAKLVNQISFASKGYILTNCEQTPLEPRTMQNHFKRALQKSGIAPANYHSLRHTFATRCIELGFDVKSLSEILGHASVNITMNRYVHPTMELKQENMQRLSTLLAVK